MSLPYFLHFYFYALRTLHVLLVVGGGVQTPKGFHYCISFSSGDLSSRTGMFKIFFVVLYD